MELWDLYDEYGRLTGETWARRPERDQHIPDGRYHLVCDVLIRNKYGEYLLTLRDPHKEVHPGEWEASAGGSALAGETPGQAAEREMLEETGLTAAKIELIARTVGRKTIYYSYLADTEAERDAVRLQEGETVAYRWVDAASLIAFMQTDQGLKAHNDRYRSYIERLQKQTGPDGDEQDAPTGISIAVYDDAYRSGMIAMVKEAREALGLVPDVREDLNDVMANYLDKGDMFWLALDENGQVAGCLGCSRIEGTDEAFLHRFYVKADRKRQGIGTALLRTAEAFMRERGIRVSKVHLGEDPGIWYESYAFYPKHGYRAYAPRYMRKGL